MLKARYALLDSIRGLAILNMLAYHGVWDLVYLFGFDWAWYRSPAAFIWQQGICWTFIFLSGFCWPLGRKKLRRALIVLFSGFLISLVTILAMPESRVIFGVLTLIGSAMLLLLPLDGILRRVPPAAGMAASFLLFALTKNVNQGYLGFGAWNLLRLPEALYSGIISAYLGFPTSGFFSSDYFSLLPWVFLFVCGYFCHRLLEKRQLLYKLQGGKAPALEWLGRHSLIIYLLHQPLIYLVLSIVL